MKDNSFTDRITPEGQSMTLVSYGENGVEYREPVVVRSLVEIIPADEAEITE